MIANPAPENLSDVYAARGFIALYRISPEEIAVLDSPGISNEEPEKPTYFDDGDLAQHDSNGGA